MNRRQFLSRVAAASATVDFANADSSWAGPPVARVLVLYKCHLDVGFIDTQANIVRKYFDVYFPQAIQLASQLRISDGDLRYIWTTGSWLLYNYLEQASSAGRKLMEDAITRGDIAWHALPFTWQSELLDASAIEGCLGFSQSLDQRFGKKTTGAKMTDVPGHCRGLIAPLASAGVTLLDIGVNSASTPPDVPDAFLWKDLASNQALTMLYHRKAYGGVIRIPRSDLAIAVEMRDDNAGPHTVEEIHQIHAELSAQFPGASIQPASLAEIAAAVHPFRGYLPVVTQEIADTWIHGVASDPLKLAQIRELLRLRGGWVSQGKLKTGAAADLAFLSKFSLAVEHTWGTDTKTWLDFDHYTPNDLAAKLGDPKYQTVTGSWVEKRNDIQEAAAALPAELQADARARLNLLVPSAAPDTRGLQAHDLSQPLTTPHFSLKFDPATGAITAFTHKNRDWASANHPLAVFSYQTLSKADFDRFLASYITLQTDWAPKDFGKPNMEKFGGISRVWNPAIEQSFSAENADAHYVLLRLKFPASAFANPAAPPEDCFLEIRLPKAEPLAELTLSWMRKRANRMPEALWLSFNPAVFKPQGWTLTKLGGSVSPFDVVSGGNRHMHAISSGVEYKDDRGALAIQSQDAALVSLGELSPLFFSKDQPDLSKGLHFNLFNNAWGTNYVQWWGEAMRYRFTIRPA